ncbi:MAG: disulfide bond formation protein B, partial [Betaproteobacteria bacterium]
MSLSHRRIAEPLLAALLALGAVGMALVSQHVYGLQPCPWCVLQRMVFVLGAGVAVLEASALMALHRGGWRGGSG